MKTTRRKLKPVRKRTYTARKVKVQPKKPVIAPMQGALQLFWNSLSESARRKILVYLGSTPQQRKELCVRDWIALSLWVRRKLRGLKKPQLNQIGNLVKEAPNEPLGEPAA
jgi:hypothetical protein